MEVVARRRTSGEATARRGQNRYRESDQKLARSMSATATSIINRSPGRAGGITEGEPLKAAVIGAAHERRLLAT